MPLRLSVLQTLGWKNLPMEGNPTSGVPQWASSGSCKHVRSTAPSSTTGTTSRRFQSKVLLLQPKIRNKEKKRKKKDSLIQNSGIIHYKDRPSLEKKYCILVHSEEEKKTMLTEHRIVTTPVKTKPPSPHTPTQTKQDPSFRRFIPFLCISTGWKKKQTVTRFFKSQITYILLNHAQQPSKHKTACSPFNGYPEELSKKHHLNPGRRKAAASRSFLEEMEQSTVFSTEIPWKETDFVLIQLRPALWHSRVRFPWSCANSDRLPRASKSSGSGQQIRSLQKQLKNKTVRNPSPAVNQAALLKKGWPVLLFN